MKKSLVLAALAAFGAVGCESFKKGCKSCGMGGGCASGACAPGASYGATAPAPGGAQVVGAMPAAGAPGTVVVNAPAGGKLALPDYSGKTIQGPAGASVTVPNYGQQLGARANSLVK